MEITVTTAICLLTFGIFYFFKRKEWSREMDELAHDANERIREKQNEIRELIINPESEKSKSIIINVKFEEQFRNLYR